MNEIPDLKDITLLARRNAPEAISALLELAQNAKNDGHRLKAIEMILDRGFGRPPSIRFDATVQKVNAMEGLTSMEKIGVLKAALDDAQSQVLEGLAEASEAVG